MTAGLVKRLLNAIQQSDNSDVRAYRTAELACYWARIGEFEGAKKLLLQLRESHGKGEHAKVSILIILLEGLLKFYNDLDPKGRDRFERAAFLSEYFGFQDLTAITYSSLAHIDFNMCRFKEFSQDIDKCLGNLRRENYDAECRVSLVLGDAFLYCQYPSQSQAWYERSRIAYTKLGDQAAIGAITHNRSALRASNMRLAIQELKIDDSEIHEIGTEIKSSMSYQSIVGQRSLNNILTASLIGVEVCMRNFSVALESSNILLSSDSIPKHTGEHLMVMSDQALCLAKLGQNHLASEALLAIRKIDLEALGYDDRSIIAWTLSEVAKELGLHLEAHELLKSSRLSLAEHKSKIKEFYLMIETHQAKPASMGRNSS